MGQGPPPHRQRDFLKWQVRDFGFLNLPPVRPKLQNVVPFLGHAGGSGATEWGPLTAC